MADPAPVTTALPDRLEPILDAAFRAFATYGYRRTSMDDIAKGAGMSRSALYLHFRNKEDIFRSLAVRYFDEALRDMAAALNQPGQGLEAALMAAFVAKDGKFMEAVLTTPHGEELMDAGFSVTGDLAAAGEARMVEVLGDWLARRGVPAGLGTGADVAQAVIAAVKGLKLSARSLPEYRAGQARLAALFARALA
ncbi:helix-turn-helix transcriptional regulator [Rhodobacter sp. HX-7-19]|uniref:Helix-turn-helix transcriptional regulator n=1 Tax=Paragemmobacter kunshanensis TaxID=2583234 RepID=A0A6M1U491_9RHOB|nr:TetR/AcrR family transcriptional regulator [Rhodobacter kunshanensis]NGQ89723.1 helix-turn-helix transcriptional regulator [Rhodobacter kunshanensis]